MLFSTLLTSAALAHVTGSAVYGGGIGAACYNDEVARHLLLPGWFACQDGLYCDHSNTCALEPATEPSPMDGSRVCGHAEGAPTPIYACYAGWVCDKASRYAYGKCVRPSNKYHNTAASPKLGAALCGGSGEQCCAGNSCGEELRPRVITDWHGPPKCFCVRDTCGGHGQTCCSGNTCKKSLHPVVKTNWKQQTCYCEYRDLGVGFPSGQKTVKIPYASMDPSDVQIPITSKDPSDVQIPITSTDVPVTKYDEEELGWSPSLPTIPEEASKDPSDVKIPYTSKDPSDVQIPYTSKDPSDVLIPYTSKDPSDVQIPYTSTKIINLPYASKDPSDVQIPYTSKDPSDVRIPYDEEELGWSPSLPTIPEEAVSANSWQPKIKVFPWGRRLEAPGQAPLP